MVSSIEKFYGWKALTGAMLVYFCGCACCFYSIGVFIPLLYEELNSSLAVVAGVITMFMVLMGLVGPLIGISIDKFGARKNIIYGNLVSALGLAGMYFINQAWQLYLLFGVIVALGQGFGMFVPATTLANNWFIKKRSLAVALIVASGSIGGFVGPSVTRIFISNLGWRLSWVCLSGILVVISVIIGGMLIRNRPEDLGQAPDGKTDEDAQESESTDVPSTRVYQTPVDWETGDALRTPVIWMLVAAFITHMFALNTMIGHLVFYLEKDLGFTKALAAFVFGLIPGMSIVGRLSMGFLAMRYELRYIVSICLGLMVVGMSILMTNTSLSMIYVFAVLFGISYGAIIPALPSFIGAYYGRENFAKILGWLLPITTIFGASSAPLAGMAREASGSYIPWFTFVAILLAGGGVLAFMARPPKPNKIT
ncbi:MAG: MFS transporter [Spirochaetota bacterium]|nr:MFS transporter [Spirochaetota bacterium]